MELSKYTISWNKAREDCLENDADLIDIDLNSFYAFQSKLKKLLNSEKKIYVCNLLIKYI